MRQAIKSLDFLIKGSWTKNAVMGISASILLAICAPFSMHLPFTPIPITVQVQVALLLSALLGPVRAVWMVGAFLVQGIIGWPVFAGGASTIATIIGPRGGYLIGYLVAAYIVGKIYQARKMQSAVGLFFSMSIGNLVVYLLGFLWLSLFVGTKQAFFLGIAPFALADLVKITMIACLKYPLERLLHFLQNK